MDVAIIGGGAAGFFSALAVKENYPKSNVWIFEKSQNLLSKVKISGGGRCNVTNACSDIVALSKAYPRGGSKLKKLFGHFSTSDTMEWFRNRGVPLMVQEDNCVFPVSQNSQSIIDCFFREARKYNIKIETGKGVKQISKIKGRLQLTFIKGEFTAESFDKVIIATGGSPKRTGLEWLEAMGHKIEDPVPSLFTFNMPQENVTNLMGVVVKNTLVNIQGTKYKSEGPLLITHWGMSGPAILVLSAFGARTLSELNYKFNIQVNWVSEKNDTKVLEELKLLMQEHAKKIVSNIRPYFLPERLWLYMLEKLEIPKGKKWSELSKKEIHKIVNVLTNDIYNVNGKTTFKEEFVTCGGVSLDSIDFASLQSKACDNVYFAGEVLDIDAITGGYNFQAAWTTAYIAGRLK